MQSTQTERARRVMTMTKLAIGTRCGIHGDPTHSGRCESCDAERAGEPRTRCHCGNGPFFYVPNRAFPSLCLDCADDASRERDGWTVANSVD